MPEQSETSVSGRVCERDGWPTRVLTGCRSKVSHPEVAAYMPENYNWRDWWVDAAAKWDVRKWQRMWLRTMTDERGKGMPKKSETFGSGAVFVSYYRSEMRRPEVTAYMTRQNARCELGFGGYGRIYNRTGMYDIFSSIQRHQRWLLYENDSNLSTSDESRLLLSLFDRSRRK